MNEVLTTDKPMLSMWFGNFFEPFYSDREATREGIADITDLGFTTVNLDSKAWVDFFARYRGEPASPYVAMQEFMMDEAERNGLDYTCLALYLCGDNLYPNIRDVPPVRGEEAVLPNGEPMGTYNYRSPKAQASMVEHIDGLLKLYGEGMRRRDGRIVVQTMFDPIPKPSFDEEGKAHYRQWLAVRYENDIAKLNDGYRLKAASFESLEPEEYWLRPEALNWVGCALPTAEDFENRTADFSRWIDNQTYLAEMMEAYFAAMKPRWHERNIFIEPVLHQWGCFFNPPGVLDWQTGQRALDIYRLSPHVDCAMIMSAPLNAENRPDAAALSVECAIMRCANAGRDFTGGLYLGRHVNSDIYSVVPPAECYGTHVANGAKGMHIYGYSGLDDGGVMFRMDPVFKESLKTANAWAAEVIPLIDQSRAKEAAILFPAEMSLYEPLCVDEGGRHRMDLLGWYQQFTDLGWHVDILHPEQVAAGALKDYQHLVVPHNPLYDLSDHAALEAAVLAFVEAGGTLFHGPHCELAQRAFAIGEEPVEFDGICWKEDIIPHGWSNVAFRSGETLGKYIQNGKAGIAQTNIGRGRVVSIGFQYGCSYSRNTMPIVPPQYGKSEMHPVVLLKKTPIEALIGTSPLLPIAPIKGVEFARFGKRMIVVNHRSGPVDISGLGATREVAQYSSLSGRLAAHSASYLEF